MNKISAYKTNLGMDLGRQAVFFFLLLLFLPACSSLKQSQKSSAEIPQLSPAEKQKFDYYYYEGLRLRDEHEYDKALESFLLCYKIDSLSAGINSDIGLLYALIGLVNESTLHLKKALALQPQNWWYNVRLINLLAEQKKYGEAVDLTVALQKHFPYKEDVYYMQAAFYTQLRQFEKAISAYDQMEKIVGINEELSFEKFRLYVRAGKFKKGIAEIDRLIEKYPAETRYKVLRGDIYMQQKQADMALAIYEQVLAEDPKNPHVYVSFSEYYKFVNQPEKALDMIVSALKNEQLDIDTKMEILEKHIENLLTDKKKIDETEDLFKLLIEHYPLEEQVHTYYAIFLQYQERKEEMMDELKAIIYINPQNDKAWFQLIQNYFTDGNYEQAVETATKAIENNPQTEGFYFYKSLVQNLLKDPEGALETSLAGLALFENEKESNRALQSDFYSQIGDIYYNLNEKEKAFEAYENALKANPGNIYTMNNYAYYLSLEKENLRRAERLSAKTVEVEPDNSTYLDTYAWILYQQGSYLLAKLYIERAISNLKNDEENGVIYDHYGDILWKNSDQEKAVEMWNKALNAGLDTEELKQKIETGSLPEL